MAMVGFGVGSVAEGVGGAVAEGVELGGCAREPPEVFDGEGLAVDSRRPDGDEDEERDKGGEEGGARGRPRSGGWPDHLVDKRDFAILQSVTPPPQKKPERNE